MANARKIFVPLSMMPKKRTNEKVGRANELQEEKGKRERKLREEQEITAASREHHRQQCATSHHQANQTENLARITSKELANWETNVIIGTPLHACITKEELVKQAKIAFFCTHPKREATLGTVLKAKARAKIEAAARAATKVKAKAKTARKEEQQKNGLKTQLLPKSKRRKPPKPQPPPPEKSD
jgi:hypothetical protein